MKQCTYCGREYSDEATVCATDGHPLRVVIPALSVSTPLAVDEKQKIVDDEHIKLLSLFHFIIAGLSLVGMAFLLLHYFVMRNVFSNPDLFKGQTNMPQMPQDIMKILFWFYVVFGFILITVCVLNLLSGLFLRQKKYITFSLLVGGLNCLQIPFGTILGIFTIMILTRKSVRDNYEASLR